MEKLITKITDNDFGLKFGDMEKPQLRKGARGIVIREDGKIAIFNKANKHEYKLPHNIIVYIPKPIQLPFPHFLTHGIVP